jgi:hypothetical protein
MRRCLLVLAVALIALPLASCLHGMDIEVAGQPGQPDFLFSRAGFLPGKPPSADSLRVDKVSGDASSTVWSISRDPSCEPTRRVQYGVVPAGWREFVASEALAPGVTYVATASGCGFYGGVTFKVLDGKIVARHGNGDMPVREVEAM